MRKKMMSLFITAIMVTLWLTFAAEASNPSSWSEASVKEAIGQGLVPESLQQDYTKPISREGFSMLIMQTLESIEGKNEEDLVTEVKRSIKDNPFKDTSEPSIIAAYHLGIINGKSADVFAPQASLLRKEAAVIVTNAANALSRYTYNLSSTFKDRKNIDSWALNSVDYVAHRNIMNGTANDSFNPNGTFTVEQAIITALRLYKDDGQLRISNERRQQILKDGLIKRANTYTGWAILPDQLSYYDSANKYKFTEDVKPVGTQLGYAIETDTTVYMNGKYVKSYAVGDLDVINIKDLESFGFEITQMTGEKYTQLHKSFTTAKNVLLVKPMIDNHEDIVIYRDEKVDKSNVLIGNTVYTLIGSDYQLTIYDPSITWDESSKYSYIKLFTATTGDRFVAVQELTNRWYQAHEWDRSSDEFKYARAHGDWYQPDVKQQKYYYLGVISDGNNALVDYTKDKELHVYTLGARERNLLMSSGKWWAIALYPSLAGQLLSEKEQEAFQFAQVIIADIIQPDMSDRDKVDAIQNYLSNFDANFDGSHYISYSGGVDPRQQINGALLDRDANLTGWINTSMLLYSLAGLDVFPQNGTKAYMKDKDEENFYKMPVNIDGVWEFVFVLF